MKQVLKSAIGALSRGSTVAMAVAAWGALLPPAMAADSLGSALSGGKAGLDLRYRYEYVDQTGMAETAAASTLRTRLNYATGGYYGGGAFIEFDDVTTIGGNEYNDGGGLPSARTAYPVVVDPAGTEVNQAWLSYQGWAKTTLKLGRQRIIFDNARFIGNVGWRQNEQTYDGLTVANAALKDTAIVYAYVNNVNRIFGEASPKADLKSKSHLLNVSYGGLAAGKITAYGYLLDFTATPAASNSTLGLRFGGGTKVTEGVTALYTLEYAQQSDYKDGAGIDADYSLIELGLALGGINTMLGYEVLGADTSAFSTPLATLHAFNGWADKFLVTPANGLVDAYLSVGVKLAGVQWQAVYHDFAADKGGGAEYGAEVDLQAAKQFCKHYTLLAKYAGYSADTFATDTDKIWFMAQAQF